jgi:hypothetical protein
VRAGEVNQEALVGNSGGQRTARPTLFSLIYLISLRVYHLSAAIYRQLMPV